MHENRRKERGFNQVDVLAKDIASATGKVNAELLVRTRHTPHQTGLDKANRQDNIKGAFKVMNKSKIKGKTILLVDDIYTTGATINECARTLKSAGAKSVYSLCLCRTPINYDNIFGEW